MVITAIVADRVAEDFCIAASRVQPFEDEGTSTYIAGVARTEACTWNALPPLVTAFELEGVSDDASLHVRAGFDGCDGPRMYEIRYPLVRLAGKLWTVSCAQMVCDGGAHVFCDDEIAGMNLESYRPYTFLPDTAQRLFRHALPGRRFMVYSLCNEAGNLVEGTISACHAVELMKMRMNLSPAWPARGGEVIFRTKNGVIVDDVGNGCNEWWSLSFAV